MTRTARERWIFTIEPLVSPTPAVNRVRSALKVLLRRFGLKCVTVRDAPSDLPPGSPQSASAAFDGTSTARSLTLNGGRVTCPPKSGAFRWHTGHT
jgi:hypothetical protein